MRALLVCALAFSFASSRPAVAQEDVDPFAPDPFGAESFDLAPDPDVPTAPPDVADPAQGEANGVEGSTRSVEPPTLDSLFASLKREPSAARAETIAARIQAEWLRSGSDTVDLLLGWAAQAARTGNPAAAFDLYEQAMLLRPDHAGAWNGRATLNFQLERYGRSLADIEQTLRREPRHFGALMGLAAMLEEMNREEEALDVYRRVLEIYPALRDAQNATARLTSGQRGQSL